jgi:hypothetical protein
VRVDVRAHFNAITFSVPSLTLTRDGYSIRLVGRHWRRPPVPARIAHAAQHTRATARAKNVFPSDESNRAQQWCCKECGPIYLGRRQATFQRMVMFA